MTALLALQVLPPGQSRVLHALLVNMEEELLSFPASPRRVSARVIILTRPVHAVIRLVPRLGLLEVPADATVVDESPDILVVRSLLLLRLQHVVALPAEAHALECCHLAEKLTLLIFNYNSLN